MDVIAKNLLLERVCENCKYYQWFFQMTKAVCIIDAYYRSDGINKIQEGAKSIPLNNTCRDFQDGRKYSAG